MTTQTVAPARPSTRFREPGDTTAPAPPEYRGLERGEVRLLVATPEQLTHTRFPRLPEHLRAGDLVVVNTSATVPGEIDGHSSRHGPIVLHVATPLPEGSWVVELRTSPDAARPVLDARPGDEIVAAGVVFTLESGYPAEGSAPSGDGNRLWQAHLTPGRAEADVRAALDRFGRPISYGYLSRHYPLAAYQPIFARHPGSAEMASAARPFTPELVVELVTSGVLLAPVTLHTGVSSQEAGELPQPERFRVPAATADLVNHVRDRGGRVVAAGTTVTRALESAVGPDGLARPAQGWTERLVSVDDPPRVVDGLITGWHDPHASHLLLVESIAGAALTQRAYDAAVAGGYLWHEFGDSALLLPR